MSYYKLLNYACENSCIEKPFDIEKAVVHFEGQKLCAEACHKCSLTCNLVAVVPLRPHRQIGRINCLHFEHGLFWTWKKPRPRQLTRVTAIFPRSEVWFGLFHLSSHQHKMQARRAAFVCFNSNTSTWVLSHACLTGYCHTYQRLFTCLQRTTSDVCQCKHNFKVEVHRPFRFLW